MIESFYPLSKTSEKRLHGWRGIDQVLMEWNLRRYPRVLVGVGRDSKQMLKTITTSKLLSECSYTCELFQRTVCICLERQHIAQV